MWNIILKKWEVNLEINSRPSVQQMDRFWIMKRQFDNYLIGDIEFTLNTVKLLLVDKTKEIEIDEVLKWNFDWDVAELIAEWAWQVIEIFEKVWEAKKKLKK